MTSKVNFKIYFPIVIGAAILFALDAGAFGQEIVEDQVVPKMDVCSDKYLNETDTYYENRSLRQTGKQAETHYREILEKCPDNPFRYEIETKMLRVEEEMADHSFTIAMYYLKRQMQTGCGGLGARSRLKNIVENMPHYSRISDVKMWLEEINRILPTETDQ